jgi:hypothetical protein
MLPPPQIGRRTRDFVLLFMQTTDKARTHFQARFHLLKEEKQGTCPASCRNAPLPLSPIILLLQPPLRAWNHLLQSFLVFLPQLRQLPRHLNRMLIERIRRDLLLGNEKKEKGIITLLRRLPHHPPFLSLTLQVLHFLHPRPLLTLLLPLLFLKI